MSDSEDPTKNGEERANSGRFQPGHPGGPGRPLGSRNRATVLLDELAEGKGQDLLNKVMDEALGGDMRAAEIVLQRIWPVRRGRAVALKLPAIKTPDDVVAALGAVADSVAAGDITPDEGQAVASILETKRKAIETVDLTSRVEALEKERRR
jgi:uncharacterized protein DUF5681